MRVSLSGGHYVLPSALFLLAIGGTTPLTAQVATGLDPYHHTYDSEHGYVPVGGYSGGGTAAAGAGVAAAGYGQAAQGVGQMHLSNAQAAGAYEDAVNQYLQNKALAEQTLQQNAAEQRQADDAAIAREKAQGRAQVALYKKTLDRMSAAHRLTAEQFDMGRGVLHWPFVLRGPEYQELRNKLDVLYDGRTPEDSGTNSSGYGGIVEACEALQKMFKEDVKKGMPVTDYVTATHFVSSIQYEAQFPVKASQAAVPQQADAPQPTGSTEPAASSRRTVSPRQ